MCLDNKSFNPAVITHVGNNRNIEIHAALKTRSTPPPVAIDKVARIGNGESVPPQEPLVDLHLPLVTVLPPRVNRDRLVFTRRLIVHHQVLPVWRHPQVVNGSRDYQVGLLVMDLHPREIGPPAIQLLMRAGDRVNLRITHQRMRLPRLAIFIKLFFQQVIDGRIDIEREAGWLSHPKTPVDVETARTFFEQLEL